MNEIELKIKCIVKDALHLLNNNNITKYTEGDMCDNVYYYIEQYRECSDDMIENLLNEVDVILCTEELGFEEANDEERLGKLYDKWRNIEQSLKAGILYREIVTKLTEEEFEDISRQTVLKTAVGKQLNQKETYIHLYLKCNNECEFTDKELDKIRETSIRRNYNSNASDEEIKELKEEIKEFSFKEMDYYLSYKAGFEEIELWIKED